jgi:hypothetical protein
MKNPLYSVGLAITFAATFPSWCQEQAKPFDDRPGPGPIGLSICVDHDEVGLGATLLLTVSMTNIAQDQHCYGMARGHGNGIYNFPTTVRRASGEIVGASPIIDKSGKVTISRKRFCLQGGDTLAQTMRLDQLFDLSAPGKYSVQVSRKQGTTGEVVLSNSLPFTVMP